MHPYFFSKLFAYLIPSYYPKRLFIAQHLKKKSKNNNYRRVEPLFRIRTNGVNSKELRVSFRLCERYIISFVRVMVFRRLSGIYVPQQVVPVKGELNEESPKGGQTDVCEEAHSRSVARVYYFKLLLYAPLHMMN